MHSYKYVKITEFNAIRVIPFLGKGDELPIRGEKLLAKAKRYRLKDLLLGKLSISKTYKKINELSEIIKKMTRTIKLNEIAYS
jgi:hypothetical protein